MIVCEIGLNHFGDISHARELFNYVMESNADAVTFQIREKEFYRNNRFSNMQLDFKYYKEFLTKARKHNKKFGIALSDVSLIRLFEKINVDFYKILSKDLNNKSALEMFSKHTDKKLFISTGMSNHKEIQECLSILIKNDVTLLHTKLSNKVEEVNLKSINTMKLEFNLNIGYGQHCENKNVLFAAAALEPSDIFFYIKGDRIESYPDDKHAILTKNLNYYIENIKNIEISLGDGVKLKTKNTIEGQL